MIGIKTRNKSGESSSRPQNKQFAVPKPVASSSMDWVGKIMDMFKSIMSAGFITGIVSMVTNFDRSKIPIDFSKLTDGILSIGKMIIGVTIGSVAIVFQQVGGVASKLLEAVKGQGGSNPGRKPMIRPKKGAKASAPRNSSAEPIDEDDFESMIGLQN